MILITFLAIFGGAAGWAVAEPFIVAEFISQDGITAEELSWGFVNPTTDCLEANIGSIYEAEVAEFGGAVLIDAIPQGVVPF